MLLEIGRKLYMYMAADSGGGSGGDGSQSSVQQPVPRLYTESEMVALQSRLSGAQGHAQTVKTENEKLIAARLEAEERAAQYETEAATLRRQSEAALAEQKVVAERNKAIAEKLERERALRAIVRSVDPALVNDFDDSILRLDGLDDEQARNVVNAYRDRNVSRQQQAVMNNNLGVSPTPQTNSADNASVTAMELRQSMMEVEPGTTEFKTMMDMLNAATKRELLANGKRIVHQRTDLGAL